MVQGTNKPMAGKKKPEKAVKATKTTAKKLKALKLPKPKVILSFSRAADVQSIALRLINGGKIPGVKHLADGQTLPGTENLRGLKIAYIFSSAKEVGCFGVGQAAMFTKRYLHLVDEAYTYEVVVSKPAFLALDETAQHAAIYHLLMHMGVDAKGKPKIVDHDWAGFIPEARHFEPWNSEERQLVGLWAKAR